MSLSLGAILALAALAPGPDGSGSTPAPAPAKAATKAPVAVPIEKKPYKIRAWISVDPRARLDARGRETLLKGWKVMAARFVGAPWNLEVAEGDGPLATNALDDITPEMVIPLAKGFDKAWMFRVEPDGKGGLEFSGREFDSATAMIGLVCRRGATVAADGPRAMLQLALDVFAPSAEIAEASGGDQKIRVQGAMLQSADPAGQVVSIGSVFRPVRIFYKPEGGIQLLTVIRKTYLRVEMLEGGVATCKIITSLGNPFTNKVVGKAKMFAVGLKPASIPTRLRFLSDPKEAIPLAGYDLVSRPAPDGTPREAGTTDREGRVVLPPNFSEGLVMLRLIAAGVEPLTQFPVMPGEQVEEMVFFNVDPKSPTVAIESEVAALRDEIVDLIAVRRRLETRLKSRSDAQNWDEVKLLLDDYHKLPPKESMEGRLAKIDEEMNAAQKQNARKQVRTRSAQKLMDDVHALIDLYLDEESFKAYEVAHNEYLAQRGMAKGGKALPKAPALVASKTAGGSLQFSPQGAGFTVVTPSTLSEEPASKTADGAAEVRSYRLVDQAKGIFTVAYWDYPLAINSEEIPRVLDAERDRLLAALSPGSKVTRERSMTIGGLPGKEVEFSIPGAKPGVTATQLSRIVVANSRVISASVGGPKEWLTAKPATDFLDSIRVTGRVGTTATAAAPAPARASSTPPATSTTAGAAAAIKNAGEKAAKAPSPAARPKPGGATPF